MKNGLIVISPGPNERGQLALPVTTRARYCDQKNSSGCISRRRSPVFRVRVKKGAGVQTAPGSTDPALTQRPGKALHRRSDIRTKLLLRVKSTRCEQAFNRLYEYYSPRLCAYLRQKGAPDRISQEVMQDVMARVWEKAAQFDPRYANASTWVFTIARNRFVDILRKEQRSFIDPDDPLLVGGDCVTADENLAKADNRRELSEAIHSLPEPQAEVLSLVYLNGLKQREAAEKLDIPLNTVKSRLRLALEKLRTVMENN